MGDIVYNDIEIGAHHIRVHAVINENEAAACLWYNLLMNLVAPVRCILHTMTLGVNNNVDGDASW